MKVFFKMYNTINNNYRFSDEKTRKQTFNLKILFNRIFLLEYKDGGLSKTF